MGYFYQKSEVNIIYHSHMMLQAVVNEGWLQSCDQKGTALLTSELSYIFVGEEIHHNFKQLVSDRS